MGILSLASGIIERMFDNDLEQIPPGLDSMEPGPQLAAFLSSINAAEVSDHDRIVVLRADQRMASYYAAQVYEDMAAVSDSLHEMDDDPQMAVESAAAEIRAALRLTRRTANTELALALDLKVRIPRVWETLAAGDIDVRRAKVIAHGTAHLPVDTARDVVDRVIQEAFRLTTGQLMARIRRLCIEVDPRDARRRYGEAVADRRIVFEPTESGTANLLGLDLPPHRVAAVTRRVSQLARTLRTRDESRTMDQLRADVFLDLLEGTTQTTKTGQGIVDIRVDLDTLTQLTDHPGELAGYGPVVADIARQVVEQQGHVEWRYAVTDPDTGQTLHTGATRRRPTAGQRRGVETRDPTCVFPGCRIPATDCDLDHRIPWSEGGTTTVTNLVPLCRHDHRIRHHAGWTHQPIPDGGHRWTSKLGHTYTTGAAPP